MRIGPGLLLVALTGTGVACSLNSVDRGSTVVIRVEDFRELQKDSRDKGFPHALVTAAPSVVPEFDCIGVNVVGPGIPDTSTNPEGNLGLIIDGLLQGGACTYRGILAGPVLSTIAGPQEVALVVPPGASRVIQLLGIKERNGSNDCYTEFANLPGPVYTPGAPRVEADVFEIGRAVVNLFQDETVTITPVWSSLTQAQRDDRIIKCGNETYGSFAAGPGMEVGGVAVPRGDPAVYYDNRTASEYIFVAGGVTATTAQSLPLANLSSSGATWDSLGTPTGGPFGAGAILAPGAATSEIVLIGGTGQSAKYSIYNGLTWATANTPGGYQFGYSAPVLLSSGDTYFFGGSTGSVFANIGRVLSGASAPSSVATPLPTTLGRAASVELSAPNAGKVAIVGGFDASASPSLNQCSFFDPAAIPPTLTACAALPVASHDAALVSAWNGGAFYIGGRTIPGSTYRAEMYLAGPSFSSWTPKASMQFARSEFKAFKIDGGSKIIVIGGRIASSGTLATATTEIYDIGRDSWSFGPSLATPRYGYGAVKTNDGKIIVIGGYDAAGNELSSVEVYYP